MVTLGESHLLSLSLLLRAEMILIVYTNMLYHVPYVQIKAVNTDLNWYLVTDLQSMNYCRSDGMLCEWRIFATAAFILHPLRINQSVFPSALIEGKMRYFKYLNELGYDQRLNIKHLKFIALF